MKESKETVETTEAHPVTLSTWLGNFWLLAAEDRGLGRQNFAAILEGGILVVEFPDRELAEHIINLHNEKLKANSKVA